MAFTRGHLVTLMISSGIGTGFGLGWWIFGTVTAGHGAIGLVAIGLFSIAGLGRLMDTTFRRGGHLPPGGGRGDSPFGRQYGIAVLLMVVGIFAGSRVLSAVLEMPEAVPAWVLFVVGLHFLPFVKLFGSKRFLVLGGGLCAVAVLAVILGNGGAAWAWQAIPGFGGAVVLWSIVAVGLYSTQSEMSRR